MNLAKAEQEAAATYIGHCSSSIYIERLINFTLVSSGTKASSNLFGFSVYLHVYSSAPEYFIKDIT